ncbi:MAG: Mut7-C RNAse domain-containing protein [Smithellaceae bacterium]|nr:Mut7-C RNAse domain-containing protein [Smithellaceae bacterium]
MSAQPRFITDASLTGLAKWLRLLGYDTVVYSGKAGRLMMRQAQDQRRVLLTRRRDMLERQFSGDILLLPAAGTGRQLGFVIRKLSLKIDYENMYRICLICNSRLCPTTRGDVHDLVPPFVYENYDRYNRCESCGKIYWPGTHIRNALKFLKDNDITIPVHDQTR